MSNTLFYLLEHSINLFVMIFLLRVLAQIARTDFHNPISAFIHKVTMPVVNPLRNLLPDIGKFSLAAFCFALLLVCLKFILFASLSNAGAFSPQFFLFAVLVGLGGIKGLLMISVTLLMFLFIGLMIVSFIAGNSYHPAATFLYQVTRPILRPIQKVIPPLGGTLDLSPMIVLFGVYFIQSSLLQLGARLFSS